MAVRLVALDIDGTLIHSGEEVPAPRLAAAIRALDAVGIAVVLASGRMFPGTASVARYLGLTTHICQQGCSVHVPDGTMTHEFPLERELAMAVVEHAQELGHPYEWFNPLRYIVSREHPAAVEYGRVSGITPEYVSAPEHSGIRPTGAGIISSHDEASGIHRHLAGIHSDRMHLLDFPNVTVAVASDANKGHALSLVCSDLGVDRHEVVAIGDSVNDAAMLAWAGRGIAMAHSDRYALDIADEVLESGEGALAHLLSRIVRG